MSISRLFGGLWAAFMVFAMCGIAHAQQGTDSPLSWFGLADPMEANETHELTDLLSNRIESSTGADVTETSYSTYGTLLITPGGTGRDGLRVKLDTGITHFTSTTSKSASVECKKLNELIRLKHELIPNKGAILSMCDEIISGNISDEKINYVNNLLSQVPDFATSRLTRKHDSLYVITKKEYTRYSADLTPGYQVTTGNAAITFYAGLGYEQTIVDHKSSTQYDIGVHWGGKASVHTWIPLNEVLWLSTDTSYFSGTDRYSTSARFGYKPVSWITMGPEIGHFGDRDDSTARAGAFLRIETMGLEAGISGGASFYEVQDPKKQDRYDQSPYGTASVYTKF